MSDISKADISEADKQKIKTILNGLDDSRMRLNSGVCRIVGYTRRGPSDVVEENILLAFNYKEGFRRFDQGATRSLYTPEYYYEFSEDSQVVTRENCQDAKPLHNIRPFDIRNLGFFTFAGNYSEDYTVGERIQMFKDKPISIVETNGMFTVSVLRSVDDPGFETLPIIRRYWIDSRQGFTMVRFEFYRTLDTIEKVMGTMELSWREINKTWVPTSFKFSDHQSGGVHDVDWTIDWSLVNEKIPDTYFDPTLLSDEVAVIVSLELGDPIVIGKIGPGRDPPGPLRVPKDNNRLFLFRYILMGFGIFMILLALSKKQFDYLKKRSSK